MSGSTNTRVIGLAGAISFMLMWVLHYFAPDFMATAPTGAEAAITTIITGLMGQFMSANAFMGGNQDGKVESPLFLVLVLLGGIALMVMSSGCQTQPRASDAISGTAYAITTAAVAVGEACGQTEANGPCRDGALITTDQKQWAKEQLRIALDLLDLAIDAYAVKDDVAFSRYMTQAMALVDAVNVVVSKVNKPTALTPYMLPSAPQVLYAGGDMMVIGREKSPWM
jgi:hypothetical protein